MNLVEFIRESNRIEGIRRDPTPEEIHAHRTFLNERELAVEDVQNFVHAIADAPLRQGTNMNVRVGNHVPPRGGPEIRDELEAILLSANEWPDSNWTPYTLHCRYETLHPFMDGNGRSGRAIWAWMMSQNKSGPWSAPFAIPFLHRWYYQSLDAGR